jgi:hypothetical protein
MHIAFRKAPPSLPLVFQLQQQGAQEIAAEIR